VNQVSIFKQLQADLSNGYTEKDFFEKFNSSNVDNKRVTVITSHNSKSYQVDGMTNTINPDTHHF